MLSLSLKLDIPLAVQTRVIEAKSFKEKCLQSSRQL